MGANSTGNAFVIYNCYMRTFNNGCTINKQIKVNLIFVHSITIITTAPFTEYLNKTNVLLTQDLFVTKRAKPFYVS